MKKTHIFFLLIAALVMFVAAASVQAQDIDNIKYPKLNKLEIPDVDKVTLDNGIRVYLLKDKSLPVFRASVRMNAGSFLEPADKVGLASICGTVMRTGGTTNWSGDEIDEKLEAIGGSVETYIGMESGGASVNVLSEYTDLGLEVLAEVLRNPKFEEDKIDLAKVQVRSGISRRNDDPQGIAFREFKKVIYGADSPYARHTEYATINAITRDDLVAFHGKWYKPQNMQLAIWGDFDKKDLLKKLNKYFGDWKKEGDPVPSLPQVDYKFENKVHYVQKNDVNQTNIVIGHIGGYVTDEDYGDLIVMNNILGGGFGSRLFNSVRSREGLAYSVFGSYTARIKYPGIFVGFVSTKSETTVKAVKEMLKEMKRIQTVPPTEDEMKMGQDGYLNSFVFNFDSKAEVVNRLMDYEFYGLSADHLFKVKDDVEKVTPDAVIKAANENLRLDALHIVIVGKGEDFEIPLDQMGLGDVVDIDITIPSGEEEKELAITPESLEKGKALLDKAVTFAGGLENVKKVQSISQKGTFSLITPQGELPLQYESIWVAPDKHKDLMTMMGQNMHNVRNGNTGWKTGRTGLEPMTEDDIVKANQKDLRRTILIFQRSDNPDYKIVYDGKGNVNGTDIEYISLLNTDDASICRLGIAANGSLVCKEYWGESPMGEGNIQEIYGDFAEHNNVKFSMKTTRTLNGNKFGESVNTAFSVNGEIPANTFDKPE